MRLLKVLGLLAAAAVALFVLIGLFLDRKWSVEASAPTTATAAQVLPLVKDFREWSKWTTTMPDYKYEYSPDQGTRGAWMTWQGPGSRAKFILTDVTEYGIRYDGQMESDEVNSGGELRVEGGKIIWKDSGTLPPIIGGYFRGVMNKALFEHMTSGLEKLKTLAEAAKVEAPPPPVDAKVAADVDGGVVDAGVVTELDAGAP